MTTGRINQVTTVRDVRSPVAAAAAVAALERDRQTDREEDGKRKEQTPEAAHPPRGAPPALSSFHFRTRENCKPSGTRRGKRPRAGTCPSADAQAVSTHSHRGPAKTKLESCPVETNRKGKRRNPISSNIGTDETKRADGPERPHAASQRRNARTDGRTGARKAGRVVKTKRSSGQKPGRAAVRLAAPQQNDRKKHVWQGGGLNQLSSCCLLIVVKRNILACR